MGGFLSLGQILLGELLLAGAGTSGSSAGAFAAAAFSAWTAAQISSRYTGMDLGAAMPMRTVEPVTSITSMQMSFDDSDLLACTPCDDEHRNSSLENGSGRVHPLLRRRPLEERGADGGVGGLVDDLVAAAT